VTKYDINIYSHVVTFVFNEATVSLETIIKNLESGGFPPEGPPQFLDTF
jgi:hypothetical protein